MNTLIIGYSIFIFICSLNIWAWTPIKYLVNLPIFAVGTLFIMFLGYISASLLFSYLNPEVNQ